MADAVCNGVKFSYRQLGDGPDVVLVHGLASNMAFWPMPVLRRLAARFRLTLYDLRGHGRSEMPPSGYTTAEMAADLDALLDHAGVTQAHLVGHSYGAAIALSLASAWPERVLSLTLADAVIAAIQPAPHLRDWPEWERWAERLRALGIDVPEDHALDQGLLELIAHPDRAEARSRLGSDRLFLPWAGWNAGRRGAEQWRRLLLTTTARGDVVSPAGLTPERIAGLTPPICAIYGEHSHCLPTFDWLRGNLPHCRAVVVPGVGHFHPAVAPGLFAAHLIEFLSDVSGARSVPDGLELAPGVHAGKGEHA
jgi:pimeloyl-ACP methyl ester carboxylesterase